MTLTHRFSTTFLSRRPSVLAVIAAVGAMMLVSRDWAPQVGLAVYFSVAVLMPDGFNLIEARTSDVA